MYKLVFFVPQSHLDSVKSALFARGAGADGDYSHACWQVEGEMQYLPTQHTNPRNGKPGEIAQEKSVRVEMVCQSEILSLVIAELIKSHPDEKPAYEIYRLERGL